ncbi:MAG: hypothetical protein KDG89_01230 [Geminicoccaceae bacterium]|nr:hypothetical protein [Geminicoccaceae bacterium]
MTRTIALVLLLGLGGFSLAACDDNDGPAENAGEAIDNAAENTGEAINDAAENTGEVVEDAGENMQDKAN